MKQLFIGLSCLGFSLLGGAKAAELIMSYARPEKMHKEYAKRAGECFARYESRHES